VYVSQSTVPSFTVPFVCRQCLAPCVRGTQPQQHHPGPGRSCTCSASCTSCTVICHLPQGPTRAPAAAFCCLCLRSKCGMLCSSTCVHCLPLLACGRHGSVLAVGLRLVVLRVVCCMLHTGTPGSLCTCRVFCCFFMGPASVVSPTTLS
jgi:hypothetical protein